MTAFLRFLLLALTIASGPLCAQEVEEQPIQSVVDLRGLFLEEASQGKPVDLTAQVLALSPNGEQIFLHTSDGGVEADLTGLIARDLALHPGLFVKVRGVTAQGSLFPKIQAHSIHPSGEGPLPPALPLSRENLFEPDLDGRWVQTEGSLSSLQQQGPLLRAFLTTFETQLELHLTHDASSFAFLRSLLGQKVAVQGVLVTLPDEQREVGGRHLVVPSTQFVLPDAADARNNALAVTIANVKSRMQPEISPVRIRGTVTYLDDSRTVIQSGGDGLLIRTANRTKCEPGDLVEATGFIALEPFTNALRSRSVEPLGPALEKVEPIVLSNLENIDLAGLDHLLITLEAELIDLQTTLNGTVFTCLKDGQVFQAGVGLGWSELDPIAPKSTIRLTGILQRAGSSLPLNPVDPRSFQLLIPGINSIEVLESPSRFDFRLLLNALAVLVLIAAAALAWVYLLRRKVNQQTQIIADRVARESMNSERERVARELHDSLEQNLSAVAFQIENALRFFNNEKFEKLGPALEISKKMAKACQRESREAIYDLRGSEEEAGHWRDEMLLSEAERLGSNISLKISGQTYSLPSDKQRQLRRIVREATYNGLRHGKSKEIRVEYIYEPHQFTAIVRDNGKGFNTKGPRPEGHFGLAGMEERAGRIGAKFSLESELGYGTTVSIRLPVDRSPSSSNNSPTHD